LSPGCAPRKKIIFSCPDSETAYLKIWHRKFRLRKFQTDKNFFPWHTDLKRFITLSATHEYKTKSANIKYYPQFRFRNLFRIFPAVCRIRWYQVLLWTVFPLTASAWPLRLRICEPVSHASSIVIGQLWHWSQVANGWMVPFSTQSSFIQFSSTQYVIPKIAHSWLFSLVFAIEILATLRCGTATRRRRLFIQWDS
jgi:hypothetical protein